jgi:hypothetical protein
LPRAVPASLATFFPPSPRPGLMPRTSTTTSIPALCRASC